MIRCPHYRTAGCRDPVNVIVGSEERRGNARKDRAASGGRKKMDRRQSPHCRRSRKSSPSPQSRGQQKSRSHSGGMQIGEGKSSSRCCPVGGEVVILTPRRTDHGQPEDG